MRCDSDFAVTNRPSGNVYNDVLAPCQSCPAGMPIYAASVGLQCKESEMVKALHACTTH